MALKRIVGSVVRHPLAATALVAGVAKGTAEVMSRVARGRSPLPPQPAAPEEPAPAAEAAAPVAPKTAEDVTRIAADGHELPEPVVLYAADEPEPAPELDADAEDELVWTSESQPQSE